MRWLCLVPIFALVAGCSETLIVEPPSAGGSEVRVTDYSDLTPEQAAQAFVQVVRDVEPVAERECRRVGRNANCDFRIVIDANPNAQANAFQSLDDDGRPVLTFTIGLIATVRNADEMAFVMGHEASHHIAGHLAQRQTHAEAGARQFENLAKITGGGTREVAKAKELGAAVGAQSYSKEFELEADRIGTIVTIRAGYDPLKGAEFFNRIPDPGDQFLGSHPPNSARLEMVHETARQMGFRPKPSE